ncbi:hypothetical protein [Amycolatopsis japonica]
MSDLSPRQWGKGDPEPPAEVKQLKREDGGGYVVRVGRGWWFVAELTDPNPESITDGWPWANNQVWPLTEVLVPDPQPSQDAPNSPSSVSVVGGGSETPDTDELAALAAALRREAAGDDSDPRPIAQRLRAYADDVDEIAHKLAEWRPPQTDDETEWDYGYRHDGGRHVLGPVSEQWAWQKNREISATVWRRRSVGPWEQVEQS